MLGMFSCFSYIQLPSLSRQGDCRSYKAAVALSAPPPDPADPAAAAATLDWAALFKLARRVRPACARPSPMFPAPLPRPYYPPLFLPLFRAPLPRLVRPLGRARDTEWGG